MKRTDKIIQIKDDNYHYTHGYYTDNVWIDNDSFIASRSIYQNIDRKEREQVIVNLKEGKIEPLNELKGCIAYIVKDGIVYFATAGQVKAFNTADKSLRIICENPYYSIEYDKPDKSIRIEKGFLHQLSITNNGKYLSGFSADEGKPTKFYVINIQSGEMDLVLEKAFEKPFDVTNHGMICPEDENLLFFAHEGITFYVSNRLWLYDIKQKTARNIAKQKLDADGNLGDCFGHEMWAPDGKGLYFVKYICSPVPPKGICYVDTETGKVDLLYSGFKYWHVGVSPDGRYLVSDTQAAINRSEVILIDREDNTETLIDTARIYGQHPCHPHPQISRDNSKIIYTALDDKGRTYVSVAYLK